MSLNLVEFKKPTMVGSWGELQMDIDPYNKWTFVKTPNLQYETIRENGEYDYIIGLEPYELIQSDVKLPTCKCNTLVIQHWGEDVLTQEEDNTNLINNLKNIKYDRLVIITPQIRKNDSEEFDIYYEPFAGPRFFCHKNNEKFWYNKKFIDGEYGVKWNTNTKNKLFHSMFYALRPHRERVLKILKQDKFLSDNGYFLGKNVPNTKEFDGDIIHSEFHDNTESPNFKLLLHKDAIGDSDRFCITDVFAKQTYIELVVESHIYNGCSFMTEKVAKPYLGLQIPLFIAWPGYIQELREQGFDLFDDIINHSYDDEIDEEKKIDMVITELKTLCKMDVPKIYNELKPRLLKNQKLFYDLVYENDRNLKLWKFIFGDRV
tara:strand:- start:3257 stop:4381 length:1125 start_codon:yes stop_codon:yes gene_type:complete